jgi:hypothetical protein
MAESGVLSQDETNLTYGSHGGWTRLHHPLTFVPSSPALELLPAFSLQVASVLRTPNSTGHISGPQKHFGEADRPWTICPIPTLPNSCSFPSLLQESGPPTDWVFSLKDVTPAIFSPRLSPLIPQTLFRILS